MTITHNISQNTKFKNETLKITAQTNENIVFTGDIEGQIVFSEKGNNLIITVYGKNETSTAVDKSIILGTITLSNAGKKGIANVGVTTLKSDTISKIDLLHNVITINGTAGVVNNITGTYLNEKIVGAGKNDTIKGVGGTNSLWGLGGDDKLYGGEGTDYFYFRAGNAYSIAGDVIYNYDKYDAIELYAANTNGYKMSDIKVYKDGNDLVLFAPSNENTSTMDKITLNNFYKVQDDLRGIYVKIYNNNTELGTIDKNGNLNYSSKTTNVKDLIQGKGKLVGSDADNTFAATGKATIITGAGNDTIYVSDKEDTINVTGSGTKTININSTSGNQVINVNDKSAVINIKIANQNYLEYCKINDDLLISSRDTKNHVSDITITNYFAADFNKSKIKLGGAAINIEKLYIVATNKSKTLVMENSNIDQVAINLKNNDTVVFNGGSGERSVIVSATNNSYVFNNSKVSGNFVIDTSIISEYLGWGGCEYKKLGNDLIFENKFGGKKYTQTFKDYFTNTNAPTDSKIYLKYYYDEGVYFTDAVEAKGLIIEGVSNKTRKTTDFIGSKYSDCIVGTKGADYVESGSNNDLIYTQKGIDTIVINGAGNKYIKIDNGDGQDIIDIKNTSAVLNFDFNEGSRYYYTNDNGNKILNRVYDTGKAFTTEKTTIKNYQDGKIKIEGTTFKLSDNPTIVDESKSKEGKTINITSGQNKLVLASSKDDTIIANGNDADIFAGNGKDSITIKSGSAWIDTGKGDDEIIVTGGTDIDFYIKAGDGNDTINFKNIPTGNINYYIDFKGLFGKNYNKMANSLKSGKMKFSKDGNDLIFTKLATTSKSENIVIKNYFGANHSTLSGATVHSTDLEEYGYEPTSIKNTINYINYDLPYLTGTKYVFGLNINGVSNGDTTTFTGVNGYDNVITFNGKGKAIINGSSTATCHDTYLTTISNKTIVTLKDLDGINDVLFLNNSKGSLSLFFNVDKNGKVGNTDELYIFKKGSMTAKNMKSFYGAEKTTSGYVAIDDYFVKNNSYTNYGDGKIDVNLGKSRYDIKANLSELYLTYTIGQIGEAVTAWLGQNNYSSTMEVLNSGIDKDINSLMKVYTSAKLYVY